MITYEADETVVHRLDPRSKLLLQVGFALAVVTHSTTVELIPYTAFALLSCYLAGVSIRRVLWSFRAILLILAAAPVFASLTWGSPWIIPERALRSLIAGYAIVLVLFVSAAYVRTTPIRDTRAAIQRHLPGRAGQLLGVGISLVFRLFPVMLRDVQRIDLALAARSGTGLTRRQRIRLITVGSIRKAFGRADTLSLALKARCFSWNPTLPALSFSRVDYPVVLLAVLFVAIGILI